MQLTESQNELAITAAIVFIFIVGLLYIIKTILRTIKRISHKIVLKTKRTFYKHTKKSKGFKNYQNNTWCVDGSYWNDKKKKWEKPDFRK